MLAFSKHPEYRILRGRFIRSFVYCAFNMLDCAFIDKYGMRYIGKWGIHYVIYVKWSSIPEFKDRFHAAHILDIAPHVLRINGYEQAIANEVRQIKIISGEYLDE